tara:strand:- start:1337 stop:1762 length:426 start_codon:yes stop_codon:yes gene_type:complete
MGKYCLLCAAVARKNEAKEKKKAKCASVARTAAGAIVNMVKKALSFRTQCQCTHRQWIFCFRGIYHGWFRVGPYNTPWLHCQKKPDFEPDADITKSRVLTLSQVKKCMKKRERMLKARSRATSLETIEDALALMKITSKVF